MRQRPALRTILERFADSNCSWFSTVRPDGRCHSAPVWHVWLEGRAYVVACPNAVKTRNIRHNPNVVLTHPDPLEAIIIEGTAATVENKTRELSPLFDSKYGWNIAAETDYTTTIEVMPTKVMAWGRSRGATETWRWSGSDLVASLS